MTRPFHAQVQLTSRTRSRTLQWLTLLIMAIFLLALARGVLMLTANPLVALANNYDQVRYTACLDLYPLRPGQDPAANNPQAPLELYTFQHLAGPDCYWTSDLAFQGTTVAIYQLEQMLSRDTVHSVRILGTVRLLAWIIGAGWLCSAFWREGKLGLALANAVWLAALGFDPVNSIYLNTYYAEAGTLFFAYITVGLTVLTAVRRTPARIAILLLTAALLGLGKMQHLALPLFLATAVAVSALHRARQLWPAALALGLGGAMAFGIQWVQLHRNTAMIDSIAVANKTSFVLSALLPASSAPAKTAERLGLTAGCAANAGKSFYTIGGPAETVCPGIRGVSRAHALGLLGSEPMTVLRMLASTPPQLLPWIPRYLGTVADENLAPLPDRFASIDRVFDTRGIAAWLALLSPCVGWLVLMVREPKESAALAFSASCSAIAVTVPIVSIFGDGRAELAKHSHLALNAGCAFLVAGLACVLIAAASRLLPPVAPQRSSDGAMGAARLASLR